jgi:hypothetical protein
MGEDGYLSAKGLIALPASEAEQVAAAAKEMKTLDAALIN